MADVQDREALLNLGAEMSQDLTTQPKAPKLAGQEVSVQNLLDRYLKGETGPEIAKSYGVTKQALSLFMYQHGETEWKQAQFAKAYDLQEQAIEYLAEIKTKIATADKEERDRLQLDLAHAREQLKSAQWTLEKVARRVYGADQPTDTGGRVTISINLGSPQTQHAPADDGQGGRVIDVSSGERT